MQSIIKHEFSEHLKVSKKTMESIGKPIEIAAKLCIDSLKNSNKILIFGNGGSAADAQHIAAELVGRYKTEGVICYCTHYRHLSDYFNC